MVNFSDLKSGDFFRLKDNPVDDQNRVFLRTWFEEIRGYDVQVVSLLVFGQPDTIGSHWRFKDQQEVILLDNPFGVVPPLIGIGYRKS